MLKALWSMSRSKTQSDPSSIPDILGSVAVGPVRQLRSNRRSEREDGPVVDRFIPRISKGRPTVSRDPHDLKRFVDAQARDYEQALAEIRSGRKRSHWMWYIFPQFDGLGFSPTSEHYAIKSSEEAEAFLGHPVLGPRLLEISEAALGFEGRSANQMFGSPDDLKFKSCATLFESVSPPDSVFARLLDKYFSGERDEKTLALIKKARG